jgi:hypothetical protein
VEEEPGHTPTTPRCYDDAHFLMLREADAWS